MHRHHWSDVKLTIRPKPDKDVLNFDCHICVERFSTGPRDPDASKIEQCICSYCKYCIRKDAATRDHIKHMQVGTTAQFLHITLQHLYSCALRHACVATIQYMASA